MSAKDSTAPLLPRAPSEAVEELLQRGKLEGVMALYRQKGATSTDITGLTTADKVAIESDIS